jgi:hypothetical protein
MTSRAAKTPAKANGSKLVKPRASSSPPGSRLTAPNFYGGRVLADFADFPLADGQMPHFVDGSIALEAAISEVNAGDLSGLEGMLVAQAHALNAVFASMISRARKIGTSEALNTLGGLALRAQNQSRATIDSIVGLKFPRQPTAFIKQQNVAAAGGQQVVQNGAPASRAPAREGSPQNELLLEANASPILEPRATRRASRSGNAVEAVEVINRAAKPRGKSHVRT